MPHKGQIKRHARSILVSRLFVIAVMVLLQLVVLLLLIQRLSQYFYVSYILFVILSVVVAISIANSHSNPSYKLAWIVPVLVFPLFGGVLYLLFGRASSKGSLAVYFSRILSQRNPKYTQDPEVIKKLEGNSFQLATESKYLSKMGFPVYHGSPVRYFSTTEEAFVRMKELIRSAERYIFMEYFIVDIGEMWDELESLLVQKVSEGVEVRIIYDGMGSFLRVPGEFAQRLSKLGISVHQFMPVVPVLTSMHNNRDHRK
ncbi:MAG: PLDc N-terminal domain-containing protein, partial [Oscillospiraceae bacterium]|nr:PLDc N-terminal domain-containing protein [Oscillospiraceae bacterium]